MSEDLLLFGAGCPQHPDRPVARVTRRPAAGGAGWLVTAEYACGHRHTQHTAAAPDAVRDTGGRLHPVTAEA